MLNGSVIPTLVKPDTWAKAHSMEWRAEQQGWDTIQHWTRTQMIVLVALSEYDVIRYVIVQGVEEADRICRWWAGHRGGATQQRLDTFKGVNHA